MTVPLPTSEPRPPATQNVQTEGDRHSQDSVATRASGAPPLTSTYRLQLGPHFDFFQAAAVLPYLQRLGVAACYTSPCFMAGENSASGYDVCDHARFQPELGGDAGFISFARALGEARLGHMIDIVPNHMGADVSRNAWWRDVLAKGRESPFAGYFDIEWQPVKSELRGKLLLPILGKPYGAALEDGDVKLRRQGPDYVVSVAGQDLPVRFGDVAPPADPDHISVASLNDILERQAYRLAYWKTASDEINYRRFFDVGDLVGLRSEKEDVFRASHALLERLVAEGTVTAIRVDHPDGLARPAEYFARLHARLESGGHVPVVVAEKICVGSETVPDNWHVDGTTGYEFLNRLGGVFVYPSGVVPLTKSYLRFIGRRSTFSEEARASKRQIMTTTMASEVDMLASRLNRISEEHWRSRDFTLNSLRRAIVELVAHLTVYRTYIDHNGPTPEAEALVRLAVSSARLGNPALEPSVFYFLEAVLLGENRGWFPAPNPESRRRFTERFQQFSASVFAKGVEDTAFYRFQPLLSLNEVGGEPSSGGVSAEDFHAQNGQTAVRWPRTLLATSTHDTKFGEDSRARISVLSERPQEWRQQVQRWRRLCRWAFDRRRGRSQVDANDAYRLYQALVGAWPCDPASASLDDLIDRVAAFLQKSAREAKRRTSWLNPDADYEAMLDRLTRETIARLSRTPDGRPPDFIREVARIGSVNSLAQVTLKLGAPGIADIYQGSERWNLSLVDPDNRRPVDFEAASTTLDELEPLFDRVERRDGSATRCVGELVDDWPSGRIKLFVTAAGLRLRREWPDVFVGGAYRAISVRQASTPGIIAFHRQSGDRHVVVAAARFVAGAMRDSNDWPIGDRTWGEAAIELPSDFAQRSLHNRFTGEEVTPRTEGDVTVLMASEMFATLPVAIYAVNR